MTTLTQHSIPTSTETPRIELNGPAPDFEAKTTHGVLRLSTWMPGKWVILFSHPADFTPVCTTEFVEFARRHDEFEKRNVALIGNSIDSVFSHIAWVRNIEEKFDVKVRFPVIADLDQKVARAFGMVHKASAETATVRCVFIMDPKRTLRAMVYYPLNVGRNIDEIVRVVDALQTADKHACALPANWKPGDAVIVPPPQNQEDAEKRLQMKELELKDWYFARKQI